MPGFLPGIHAFFPDNAKSAVVHGGDHRHRRLSGLEAATAPPPAMRHAVTARIGREGHAVEVPTLGDARVSFAGSRLLRNLTAQNGERRRAV